METRNILTFATVAILIVSLLVVSNRGSAVTTAQLITALVSLATAVNLIIQFNSTLFQRELESYARQREAVDRIWIDIQSYMESNFDQVKTLYMEMFPNEWSLFGVAAPTEDPVDYHEIYIAHKVAQACEDVMSYHLPASSTKVWNNRLKEWWSSKRLRLIWESIENSYSNETRNFINSLINREDDGR